MRPSPSDLTVSPVLLTTLVAVGGVLGVRLARATRARARPGAWRVAAACTAVVLLGVAFVSPVATLAQHYLLTAHLLQVTLVMGFAPPLILLTLPATRAMRWPRPLRVIGAIAVHPAVAIVLVNLVFFGWHVPVLYEACLAHPELYALQQVSLLLVSLGFWWSIVEPRGPGRWSLGPLPKLGYILLATIPQTFAGLVFALAHRPFYRGYAADEVGMAPLSDQQLAGACMALVSKLALFAAFSVILWRILEPTTSDNDMGDDGGRGDDGHDDEPQPVFPGAPAWLRMLETGPIADEPAPSRREPTRAR